MFRISKESYPTTFSAEIDDGQTFGIMGSRAIIDQQIFTETG